MMIFKHLSMRIILIMRVVYEAEKQNRSNSLLSECQFRCWNLKKFKKEGAMTVFMLLLFLIY